MKKTIVIKTNIFFALVLLLAFCQFSFAGETLIGTFGSESPLWDRIKDSGSTQSVNCDATAPDSWDDDMPYEQFEVISPVAENFSAIVGSSTTTCDTLLALYCEPFDPSFPEENLIAVDDDGAGYPHPELDGLPLTANTSYFLVITKYSGLDPLGGFAIQLGGSFVDANQPPTIVTLTSFAAKAGRGNVRLAWETATEIDNAGFNIYRSKSEFGGYVKINNQLILAKGFETVGASYKFVDNNVTNGRTYFYKLEDVEIDGTSTFHGPVNAKPKLVNKMTR